MITGILLCAAMVSSDAPASQAPSPAQPAAATATKDASQPIKHEVLKPSTSADDYAAGAKTPPELRERPVDGVMLQAIEANIVSYTNQERARYGLPALRVDRELMATAREHAAWMTRMRSMVHTWRAVAENIAMGQPHSSDAVRAWMNSSGHRANILNSGHTKIGVAAYQTDGGTIFWCQQFRR